VPKLIKIDLLFISYQFVKHFLAITYLFYLFLVEIFMMCVNVFYIDLPRNQSSAGWDKNKKFHQP